MNLIDFFNKLRSEGSRGVIKAVIGKIYTRAYMYKLKIPTSLVFPETKLKLEPLTPERLQTVGRIYSTELSKSRYELLKKRLEKDSSSDKTYVIVDDLNQVYGFYNIAFEGGFSDSVKYHVKSEPQTVYFFDDYTFKRWRGLGAHKVSIWSRLRLAADLGYTTATAIIRKDNFFSEQAYQRVGFTKCITITYYNLVLFRRTIVKEID